MSISFWSNTARGDSHFSPLLANDTQVDVCVVGGGLAGIATAYLLQKSGKRVCVIESKEIGRGQTERTTAHFTTALDTRYDELERLHGKEGARLAAESHRAALALIEEIVKDEKIGCDFKIVDGYLFFTNKNADAECARELAAAHRAGLEEVYSVLAVPNFSFHSGPALCFPNQIELHPLKLLRALAEKFRAAGGVIYENTPVIEVKGGGQAHVVTQDGNKIWCKAIVVATHSPINDIFAIHTKQSPYRSYVIAARVPKNSIPSGIYWDNEDPYHYLRLQPDPSAQATHEILMIGGEDHKTGQNELPEACYLRLENWARIRFPMIEAITDHWSGQVMEPVDGLAFLGHNPLDRNNIYVITGHSGNGMTYSMIASQLIRDQIFGHANAWEALYDPSRINLRALGTFMQENANVAAQYADWVKAGDYESTDQIPNGEGAIIREGAHLIAAYRDAIGQLNTCSATCPHLGGVVRWNSAEKSFDCPCHGSRFDAKGNVIEGPSASSLKPYQKPNGNLIRKSALSFASSPKFESEG
jgi:glycine/D-amino acid oxidase-like deaminating enzyme/nitrite reductase/ring-hydroxylating ferredoxin subunit